jgi:ankyrin repeat protein
MPKEKKTKKEKTTDLPGGKGAAGGRPSPGLPRRSPASSPSHPRRARKALSRGTSGLGDTDEIEFSRKEAKMISTIRKSSRKIGHSFDESEIKQIWSLLFHAGHDHLETGERGQHHHAHGSDKDFLIDASRFANIFEHRLGERTQCTRFFEAFFKDDLLKHNGKGVDHAEFFAGMGTLRHYADLLPNGKPRALPARERVLEVVFASFDDDKQGVLSQAQIRLLSSHLVFAYQSKLPESTRADAVAHVEAVLNDYMSDSAAGAKVVTIENFKDLQRRFSQEVLACSVPSPLFVFDVSESFNLFSRDPNAPPLSEESKEMLRMLKNLSAHDAAKWKPSAAAAEKKGGEGHAHGSSEEKVNMDDHLALVDLLLTYIASDAADLTAHDASGNTALHYAVQCRSSPELLGALLKRGSVQLAFQRGSLGVTPVHSAAASGAAEALKTIHTTIQALSEPEKGIALGEYLGVKDDAGFTALQRATHAMGTGGLSQRQNADIIACIRALLEFGANLSETDLDACNAVHTAARTGNLEALQAMLSFLSTREAEKEKIVTAMSNGGLTPLHWAAINGHPACCKALVEAGAQVLAANMAGQTAAHVAAAGGQYMCIDALVSKQFDQELFEAQDALGDTPLHIAARVNHELTAKSLIRLAPEALKKRNARNQTPVDVARFFGKSHEKIASTLADGPLRELSEFSRTILDKFRAGDSKTVIKMLKDPDADVLVANENGTTLLQYAAMRGRPEIATELLERGSDPNWPNNRGTRPLHKCAQYGTITVLRLLVGAKGTDLDVTDDEGQTAVHRYEFPSLLCVHDTMLVFPPPFFFLWERSVLTKFHVSGMHELAATLNKDNDKKRGTPKGIRECLDFLYTSKCSINIRDSDGEDCVVKTFAS